LDAASQPTTSGVRRVALVMSTDPGRRSRWVGGLQDLGEIGVQRDLTAG
jgi:hypothetical protein